MRWETKGHLATVPGEQSLINKKGSGKALGLDPISSPHNLAYLSINSYNTANRMVTQGTQEGGSAGVCKDSHIAPPELLPRTGSAGPSTGSKHPIPTCLLSHLPCLLYSHLQLPARQGCHTAPAPGRCSDDRKSILDLLLPFLHKGMGEKTYPSQILKLSSFYFASASQ